MKLRLNKNKDINDKIIIMIFEKSENLCHIVVV